MIKVFKESRQDDKLIENFILKSKHYCRDFLRKRYQQFFILRHEFWDHLEKSQKKHREIRKNHEIKPKYQFLSFTLKRDHLGLKMKF